VCSLILQASGMCGKNIGKMVFLMCLDVPSWTLICVLYPAICQDQSECDDFFYYFSFLNHHNTTEISISGGLLKEREVSRHDIWFMIAILCLIAGKDSYWRGVPTTPNAQEKDSL
jgi:hypothetical protein